jgi:hypothetical protein
MGPSVVAGVECPVRRGSRAFALPNKIYVSDFPRSYNACGRQLLRAGAVAEWAVSTHSWSDSEDLISHYERTASSQGLVCLEDGSSHFRVWAPHAEAVTLQIAPYMPLPVYPPPPAPWPHDAPGKPPPPQPRMGLNDVDVGKIMEV